MKIEYQEADLDTVLRYYAKGYRLPKDGALYQFEAMVDTGKRKVVFKLYIEEKEKLPVPFNE